MSGVDDDADVPLLYASTSGALYAGATFAELV
jgi:hypothetical protein